MSMAQGAVTLPLTAKGLAPGTDRVSGRGDPLNVMGGGRPMTKMSIRKAGTIRLTTACYYSCAG